MLIRVELFNFLSKFLDGVEAVTIVSLELLGEGGDQFGGFMACDITAKKYILRLNH